MTQASNSETPAPGRAPKLARPGGIERWLRSPARLFLLATLVAVAAAVVTSIGEIELQRASGLATRPIRALVASVALWFGWALLALPIFALARVLARSRLPWILTGLLHIAIGVGIGYVFLAAEIAIQERLQGPVETEAAAAAVERIEYEQNFRAMSPEEQAEVYDAWRAEWRTRRGRGRRGDRGPRERGDRPDGGDRPAGEDIAPRGDGPAAGDTVEDAGPAVKGTSASGPAPGDDSEGPTVAGGRFDPGPAPGPDDPARGDGGAGTGEEPNRPRLFDPGQDRGEPGRDASEGRRGPGSDDWWKNAPPPPIEPNDALAAFARVRTGTSVNLATGDFRADYARRWLLRVPRYGLIYLALVGLGLGLRAYCVGRDREREAAYLELRATELERAVTESRLAALTGQLHPHFLFNALHSVGGLIRSERGPEALSALDAIGDLLRTSLDAGGEQFVPLARELELVRRYLAVEELRLGDRLQVTIESDPALAECEVPAFITQPLVENAVKHGVSSKPDGGAVDVHVYTEGGETLVVDIVDDGDGYAPTTEGRVGVGLSHVRDRLATLFEDAASLEFLPAGERGGTIARLRLPLDDAFEPDAPSR